MLPDSPTSRLDRATIVVVALALLVVPLLHSSVLSEPFALPKRLAILAAGLAALGLWMASRLRRGGAAASSLPALRLAGGFLILAALSVLPAVNRALALWGFLDLAAGAMLAFAVARCARAPRDAAILLRTALGAAALVAAASLVQIFAPAQHLSFLGFPLLPPSRGGATLGDPGLAAQFLVPALPLGAGAAALSSGRMRTVCGLLLGLVLAALVFAGRPEGWIVAAATLAIMAAVAVVRAARSGNWTALVPRLDGDGARVVLTALVVVAAVVSLSRTGLFQERGRPVAPLDRVTLLSPTTGTPATDRAAAAPGTIALIARHPLGVGPDLWRHAFLEVAWSRGPGSPFTLAHQAIHPGNAFLEMAAETGVLGGLIFALLVVAALLQAGLAATRAPAPWDDVGAAACATLGALATIAFFGAPFQEPTPMLVFWVAVGLAQAAMARVDAAPRPLRALLSRPRAAEGPPPRRRGTPAAVAAAVWVALVGSLAWAAAARLESAYWTLKGQGFFYAGRYREAIALFSRPEVAGSIEHLPHALAGAASLRLGLNERAVDDFSRTLARSPYFVAGRLGRAAAHQAEGHYDLAETDLRQALAIWPDNAEFHLAMGRLNVSRGRHDAALEDFRTAGRLDATLAEPYARMADIYVRRGQYDEAIEAYRVCGTKDPRYPGLQLNLGESFYRKGMHEMALRAYQSAAAIDGSAVEPRLRMATVQHALAQYCDARDSLEAAHQVEKDPARQADIAALLAKEEPLCRMERSPAPKRR